MTKAKLNPLIEQLSGTIGDFVFRTTSNGKMILSKRPDMSNVEWSERQKEQRARFKEATAYAKAALADPKVRAAYEKRAKKEHKRPWDVAVSDYFKGKNLSSKK